LFLITLPRTAKSQEIFHLTSLCHISIRVEAYRAQTGLNQCHNCQQFGHVWATSSLFVVWRRPPAQRVPREGKPCFHSSTLQMPVGGGRESSSRQLSGLQTRQKTENKEGTENTRNYHGQGVLLKPHHTRYLFRGGTPRQRRAVAAT
jgi:hypothetical protein